MVQERILEAGLSGWPKPVGADSLDPFVDVPVVMVVDCLLA
jgi:hypothetical protein